MTFSDWWLKAVQFQIYFYNTKHENTLQQIWRIQAKLTLQLGEWNCVKIHITLQKRSLQVDCTSYLGRREHARIIDCLQHNAVLQVCQLNHIKTWMHYRTTEMLPKTWAKKSKQANKSRSQKLTIYLSWNKQRGPNEIINNVPSRQWGQ